MKMKESSAQRVCMLATTPFQILGCIALVKQLALDADLYIGDSFQNSEAVGQKLQKFNIFRNIVLVEKQKVSDEHIASKFKKRIRQIPTYLNLNKVAEGFLLPDEEYSQIYISNNTLFCRLAYLYLHRKNPDVQIVYYDDGLGTYCNVKTMGISRIEQCYWQLFVGVRKQNIKFSARFYEPELYLDIMKNIHGFIRVDPIQPLEQSAENDEIIRVVFSVSENCSIKHRAIVLDTMRREEFDQAGQEKLDLLYNKLNERYPGALIFKQHPRDYSIAEGYTYFRQRQTPFEAICYFSDLSEKILITNMSTAAFTPKMLFDQEPVIISLYEIMKEHRKGNIDFTELFGSIQKIYSDKGRVHMPQSEEVLLELLDRYLKRNVYLERRT